VTTVGPLLPTELAALFETVTAPDVAVVRALGSPQFFDSEFAEAGRATLLLRGAETDDEALPVLQAALDGIRDTAQETFGDPGLVVRLGVVDRERVLTQIMLGEGRIVLSLSDRLGYMVDFQPDRSWGDVGAAVARLPESSHLVVELLRHADVDAFAWAQGRVARRVGLSRDWERLDDQSLPEFTQRISVQAAEQHPASERQS
jgi:hypothetical protein